MSFTWWSIRTGEHSGVTTQMVRFSKVVRSIERPKWPQIDLNHSDRHHKMIIQSALWFPHSWNYIQHGILLSSRFSGWNIFGKKKSSNHGIIFAKEIVKSRRRRGKKKSSNQGVLFGKKFSSTQPCPISDKYWFSERVEEDLNLKMIKVNVNFWRTIFFTDSSTMV